MRSPATPLVRPPGLASRVADRRGAGGASGAHGRASRVPSRATVVAVGVALLGLAWLVVAFVAFPGAPAWGYDFEAYRNAAVRLAETGSLYQAETLAGPFSPGPYGLYLYPPPLGVAVGPFTAIPRARCGRSGSASTSARS